MSSEIFSYLYEEILSIGALDIYTQSIYMKKNRPAVKLSIICTEDDLENIIEIILKETSTFGVRFNKYNRKILSRKIKIINTIYGKVKVKLGYYDGKLIKVTPEYEDCKLIAKTLNLSLNKVYNDVNISINEYFKSNMLT
jgi:pyridinium-3,5-bisthiocarboxylic acid mononucleotide nickel chelatase